MRITLIIPWTLCTKIMNLYKINILLLILTYKCIYLKLIYFVSTFRNIGK